MCVVFILLCLVIYGVWFSWRVSIFVWMKPRCFFIEFGCGTPGLSIVARHTVVCAGMCAQCDPLYGTKVRMWKPSPPGGGNLMFEDVTFNIIGDSHFKMIKLSQSSGIRAMPVTCIYFRSMWKFVCMEKCCYVFSMHMISTIACWHPQTSQYLSLHGTISTTIPICQANKSVCSAPHRAQTPP